ncbi:MAG: N-acetylglucosamine-6-phosphate deacetylase [Oscillospiraceae bacterium]|jgi:N-acetylglucosamine-6-phosphate deacetylase|nr:N-acetylglucosamine-6-phosphate deacetylase [Oscillospiraceae bacterium]
MLIRDALIYGEDLRPQKGDLAVREGKIAAIGEHLDPKAWGEVLDARGARLTPGLIDIHVHGGLGYAVSDADAASLDAISRLLGSQGVTSFCPATSAAAPEALEASFRAVGAYMGRERGAYIHGVHMEGPFIAAAQRGAQDPRHMRWPSAEEARRLRRMAPISILGMAPELPGALDLAREMAPGSCVAFAHSAATYEEARAGLEAGFRHAVRLFCDMPAFHHRAPGLVGAVLDDPRATAELVCDGVHLHQSVVRMAFRLLGEDRAVAVSDAAAAAGLPEGAYRIHGAEFYRSGGAVFADQGRTLVGGSAPLYEGLRNLLSWGVDERAALRAVTVNPARVIGVHEKTGSVAVGKAADLLLADENWNLRAVMIRGILQDGLQPGS